MTLSHLSKMGLLREGLMLLRRQEGLNLVKKLPREGLRLLRRQEALNLVKRLPSLKIRQGLPHHLFLSVNVITSTNTTVEIHSKQIPFWKALKLLQHQNGIQNKAYWWLKKHKNRSIFINDSKNTLRLRTLLRYVQTELYNLIVSLHEMNTNWQFLAVDISIFQCVFAAERRKHDGCCSELKIDYI